MMSPVAYDHLSVPSRATAYSRLSCEPISTEPSLAMAGDETMGPPVGNAHQTVGRLGGSVNGDRPRCVAPNRNIACAGSIAYWGSGSAVPFWTSVDPGVRDALSAGQVQRPASQRRFSLQSRSLAQGDGSTCAQPTSTTHSARPTKTARLAAQGGASRRRKRNVRMGEG